MMSTARSGFALPVVILLALVAALAGTLLLQLQSNSSLAVNRQTRVYEDHHLAAGMRELVDQWILTGGGDIADRLEEDGLAFELELPQNRRIRVYLEDAQGTVLRDTSAVGGAPARLLDRIIDQLEVAAAAASIDGAEAAMRAPPLFRNVGPVPVSVNAASDQVLDAIAAACGNPDAARTFVRQVRSEVRPGERITAEELSSMITALRNVSSADAQELRSIFTAQPALWRLTVETRHGSLSTAPTERSAALIQLPVGGLSLGPTGVIVLSWEDADPLATADDR